jgi:hypothetical protein
MQRIEAWIEHKGSGFHLGIRISRVARLLHLLLLDRKAVTVICIAHNSDDLYLFFFQFLQCVICASINVNSICDGTVYQESASIVCIFYLLFLDETCPKYTQNRYRYTVSALCTTKRYQNIYLRVRCELYRTVWKTEQNYFRR